MALKPLARKDFIVAKKEKEAKAGDILLSANPNEPIAVVVSVGSAITDVKVGDRIVHRGRLEVSIEGEKYLMLDDDEVLSIIKEA